MLQCFKCKGQTNELHSTPTARILDEWICSGCKLAEREVQLNALEQQLAEAKQQVKAMEGLFEWAMQTWKWSMTATPEQVEEWKARCLAALEPPKGE